MSLTWEKPSSEKVKTVTLNVLAVVGYGMFCFVFWLLFLWEAGR